MKDLFLDKLNKSIDWFTNIFNAISNVPNKMADFLKTLFIPTDEDMSKNITVLQSALSDKFMFIENFKTAISNLNSAGKPLSFSFDFLSWHLNIDLAWYEPMRQKIRSGISAIFWVACALSCFGLISNVFGLSVRTGVGGIYSDSSGGKGGSKK